MIFNKFYYDDMKDYFHPNVRAYIERTSDPNDDCIYLRPFHSCNLKTRGGRRKAILYRNGNLCIFGGQFHPGKLNVWKFCLLVQYIRSGTCLLWTKNLNFYISLRETIFIILRLENMIIC